jgi:hypothetical protein
MHDPGLPHGEHGPQRDAGEAEFLVADGTLHSIALLDDDLKERILAFYERTVGPGVTPTP